MLVLTKNRVWTMTCLNIDVKVFLYLSYSSFKISRQLSGTHFPVLLLPVFYLQRFKKQNDQNSTLLQLLLKNLDLNLSSFMNKTVVKSAFIINLCLIEITENTCSNKTKSQAPFVNYQTFHIFIISENTARIFNIQIRCFSYCEGIAYYIVANKNLKILFFI